MKRLLLAALVLALGACATKPAAAPLHGRRGVHGMVVLPGDTTTFFSHIPAMHAPHDFQLVCEGVVGPGAPALEDGALYTFEPEPFSLDDLRAGVLHEFRGDLYRGNFESGGVVVARGLVVRVERVVYARPLATLPPPRAEGADYVLFGTQKRPYLLRVLETADDVDQVLAVRLERAANPEGVLPQQGHRRLEAGGRFSDGVVTTEISCLVGPEFTAACPLLR